MRGGRRQFGPYRLVARFGAGGMGEVWRAVDTRKSREVALKRLARRARRDQGFAARFHREAELAARLSSPHIVPIHDYGEIDGQLFIDMPLVEGIDLDELLDRDGAARPGRAVGLVGQVADALDAAHARRAGAPGRQAVERARRQAARRGGLRVPDRLRDRRRWTATAHDDRRDPSARSATWRRSVRGRRGDHRSDVYALACLLYETLTGEQPFVSGVDAGARSTRTCTPPALGVRAPVGPPRSIPSSPAAWPRSRRPLPQHERTGDAAHTALAAPAPPPRLAAREVAAGDPHGAGVAPDRSTGERRTPPADQRAGHELGGLAAPGPAERRRPPPPDRYARCQPGRCTAPPAEGNTRYAGVPRARPAVGRLRDRACPGRTPTARPRSPGEHPTRRARPVAPRRLDTRSRRCGRARARRGGRARPALR